MVLYLTDSTTPDDIRRAKASGFVHAAKLYPAGATTNSASGVTAIDNIFGVLETMAEVGLPLLVHGEVTRSEIDIFDREVLHRRAAEPRHRSLPDPEGGLRAHHHA